jgi:hypothetical protein
MAGSLSDYAEGKVLDLLFGNQAYTIPTTYYFGLWTTTLSDSSTGSTAGEVSTSGTGYARQPVTNNLTNFPATTIGAGSKSNGTVITFNTATTGWGTVTYVAVCDAITGGNIIVWSDLATSRLVSSGDTPQLQIGDATWTLN